ncbi:MAG: PTS sugar transporter subunit IIA [Calditrichia bacterium]
MSIGELLTEELIIPDLKGKNKYAVIEELLQVLVDNGKVRDPDEALQVLVEREQYLSTGLENGLAVPHAKSASVNELLVSFGLSREGLDFDSLDGKPAHYIFLVLSPRDTSGPHIKILAQITRNFREGGIGPQIMNAKNSREILEIIRQFK